MFHGWHTLHRNVYWIYVCDGATEEQFQIITYTFPPLNIFSIFSLSFATYNKPNKSQITTGKCNPHLQNEKATEASPQPIKQLVDGFTSRLLPGVIQKDPFILTATRHLSGKQTESTHTQETKFHEHRRESLRRHCLASVGVGHQVPQVRLLNRADVRLHPHEWKRKQTVS